MASLWGHARKLGTRSQGRRGHPWGHGAHWNVGVALASCAHSRIVPSAQHVPGWPGARSYCPPLASDPAGSLPSRGWRWHWHPPGVAVGLCGVERWVQGKHLQMS